MVQGAHINRNFTKRLFVRRRASSTARSGRSRRIPSCVTMDGRRPDRKFSSQPPGERRSSLPLARALVTSVFVRRRFGKTFSHVAPRSNHQPSLARPHLALCAIRSVAMFIACIALTFPLEIVVFSTRHVGFYPKSASPITAYQCITYVSACFCSQVRRVARHTSSSSESSSDANPLSIQHTVQYLIYLCGGRFVKHVGFEKSIVECNMENMRVRTLSNASKTSLVRSFPSNVGVRRRDGRTHAHRVGHVAEGNAIATPSFQKTLQNHGSRDVREQIRRGARSPISKR